MFIIICMSINSDNFSSSSMSITSSMDPSSFFTEVLRQPETKNAELRYTLVHLIINQLNSLPTGPPTTKDLASQVHERIINYTNNGLAAGSSVSSAREDFVRLIASSRELGPSNNLHDHFLFQFSRRVTIPKAVYMLPGLEKVTNVRILPSGSVKRASNYIRGEKTRAATHIGRLVWTECKVAASENSARVTWEEWVSLFKRCTCQDPSNHTVLGYSSTVQKALQLRENSETLEQVIKSERRTDPIVLSFIIGGIRHVYTFYHNEKKTCVHQVGDKYEAYDGIEGLYIWGVTGAGKSYQIEHQSERCHRIDAIQNVTEYKGERVIYLDDLLPSSMREVLHFLHTKSMNKKYGHVRFGTNCVRVILSNVPLHSNWSITPETLPVFEAIHRRLLEVHFPQPFSSPNTRFKPAFDRSLLASSLQPQTTLPPSPYHPTMVINNQNVQANMRQPTQQENERIERLESLVKLLYKELETIKTTQTMAFAAYRRELADVDGRSVDRDEDIQSDIEDFKGFLRNYYKHIP